MNGGVFSVNFHFGYFLILQLHPLFFSELCQVWLYYQEGCKRVPPYIQYKRVNNSLNKFGSGKWNIHYNLYVTIIPHIYFTYEWMTDQGVGYRKKLYIVFSIS